MQRVGLQTETATSLLLLGNADPGLRFQAPSVSEFKVISVKFGSSEHRAAESGNADVQPIIAII